MTRIKGCKSIFTTYTPEEVARIKKLGDVMVNDVAFDSELTREGAVFDLIREPHHSNADIEFAAGELRRTRDVVGLIYICSVKEK